MVRTAIVVKLTRTPFHAVNTQALSTLVILSRVCAQDRAPLHAVPPTIPAQLHGCADQEFNAAMSAAGEAADEIDVHKAQLQALLFGL